MQKIKDVTVLQYENKNGKMKPLVLKKKETALHGHKFYEAETSKLTKSGFKLIHFAQGDLNDKVRIFRKNQKYLVLKLCEVQ